MSGTEATTVGEHCSRGALGRFRLAAKDKDYREIFTCDSREEDISRGTLL
jgi:hypothetical protein